MRIANFRLRIAELIRTIALELVIENWQSAIVN